MAKRGLREPPFSLQRAKVLTILKREPMNILQLSKKTGIPRTTLYHHINHLKRNGLIYEEQNKKAQGKPVLLCTNRADPLALETINFMEKMLNIGNKIWKREKKRNPKSKI